MIRGIPFFAFVGNSNWSQVRRAFVNERFGLSLDPIPFVASQNSLLPLSYLVNFIDLRPESEKDRENIDWSRLPVASVGLRNSRSLLERGKIV